MIKLRDFEESDLNRLVLPANNVNVSKYLIYTFPYPYTKKDAVWWISTGKHEDGTVNKVILPKLAIGLERLIGVRE